MYGPPARLLTATLLVMFALAAPPARAADPVFPPGSLVGLVPPPGLAPSRSFAGFENRQHEVAILLITLPTEAYGEIEKSASAGDLKKQGVKVEKREPITLAVGKAFMVFGRQEADNKHYRKWLLVASTPEFTALVNVQVPEAAKAEFPDAAIRASLETLAVRKTIPDDEKLGLLPFKIADLAGFRIGNVIPGRAILLTDSTGPANTSSAASTSGDEARIVAAVAPGGPGQADDRDAFARRVFAGATDVKDVRITGSEPLRIGGHHGHQIMAVGKDARTASDVTIVQWLRFGGGGYLQLVGVARNDGWKEALTRFRAVRDSIEPR